MMTIRCSHCEWTEQAAPDLDMLIDSAVMLGDHLVVSHGLGFSSANHAASDWLIDALTASGLETSTGEESVSVKNFVGTRTSSSSTAE